LGLFGWAPFHSRKAAVKKHALLNLLELNAGAFYVMDRCYLNFARLKSLHQAGAFFVTRAKPGRHARRVYSAAPDRAAGVICDQLIAMNSLYIAKDYPAHLRRIRFKDPKSGKTLQMAPKNKMTTLD
jgi:hypothetical protein